MQPTAAGPCSWGCLCALCLVSYLFVPLKPRQYQGHSLRVLLLRAEPAVGAVCRGVEAGSAPRLLAEPCKGSTGPPCLGLCFPGAAAVVTSLCVARDPLARQSN